MHALEPVASPAGDLQTVVRMGGMRHVRRHLPRTIAEVAAALAASDLAPCEGVLDAETDVLAAARERLAPAQVAGLDREIAAAVEAFRALCGARKPTFFFGVVAGDQCRKYHVDHVAMRLVVTFHGPGTEWVPDAAVDRSALARMIEDADASNAAVVRDPAAIRRCAAGDWLFLEGEAWPGREGGAAVHRSPPIEHAGLRRLVLILTLPRSRRAPSPG